MKREIMTSLLNWKSQTKRKPLILNGVRQVGKTFTLKQFGKEHFPKYHHVDFEKKRELAKIFQLNLDPERIIKELGFYLQERIDIRNDLVIFDEIQACPEALTSLKYFCEDMPELALCSAGSLLGVHLNSVSSYPVGKVDVLTMHPMSFMEFLTVLDNHAFDYLQNLNLDSTIPEIVHQRLWEIMKYYFIVGGLPEVVDYYRKSAVQKFVDLFTIMQNVRDKQKALINSYLADMAKHSGKTNAMHLERVWHMAAMQLAKVQDSSSPKFRFKGVVPGIDRYARLAGIIDWLKDAGLVIKVSIVQKADLPLAAYTDESMFKLLLFDVGILGTMIDLSPSTIMGYDYGTYKGFFAENFVAQEFIAAGTQQLFAWQGRNSEVEFLREIDSNLLPIEVKSGNITQAKSLRTYVQKYHPLYEVVMSAKNLYIDKIRKVHYYPLYLAGKFPLRLSNLLI
jgi:uncharacterized protein